MGIIKENGIGRPRIEVFYKDIEYKDNNYTIMSIIKNGEDYYSINTLKAQHNNTIFLLCFK